MVYLAVKYIHILAAIVAVGFNLSYVVWILRAQREPAHQSFALKGIKFIDDRIANPAYGLLLVTGLLMVFLGGYSLTTLWIDVALVLFVVLVVLAVRFYTPTLREQVKLAEAGDTTSAAFTSLARRGQLVGQALGVIVLVILAMMVFKPHL
jgi:uncharacterized membrane protein